MRGKSECGRVGVESMGCLLLHITPNSTLPSPTPLARQDPRSMKDLLDVTTTSVDRDARPRSLEHEDKAAVTA